MADAHKNFAYSTIATAPSPADSGTSLVVESGHGTRFPAVSFNAVVWPAGAIPIPTNAEIVRVTNITTDTFTITRTQESTSARTIVVGDQIAATVTALTLTDVEGQVATHEGAADPHTGYRLESANHSHQSTGAQAGTLAEAALALTDVTTANATTTAHGLVVKATAPAANVLNVVGIANGEVAYTNKSIFDGTNPADVGTAAPGTSLIAAHRDHVHAAPAASATVSGIVELATTAETTTGTDATRAVTPDGLAGSIHGEVVVEMVVFDFTTDCATGDGKFYFHIDDKLGGMDLVRVHAEVITAGTTGTMDIQIANVDAGVDFLSTKLTIDSGETGSDTAATAAVINTANDDVQTNEVLRIDVDAVHSGTAAKGLIVTMAFRLP